MEELYAEMVSLYHLDQTNSMTSGKADLGPMPGISVILLISLGVIWLGILGYVIREAYRRKKKEH